MNSKDEERINPSFNIESVEEVTAFLKSVIAGDVDFMQETLADKLEEVLMRYENNAVIAELFGQALDCYTEFALHLGEEIVADDKLRGATLQVSSPKIDPLNNGDTSTAIDSIVDDDSSEINMVILSAHDLSGNPIPLNELDKRIASQVETYSKPPIFEAVFNGDFEEVRRLIASGANINETDQYGDTLIEETISWIEAPLQRFQMVELLLNSGGKISNDFYTLLTAILYDDARVLELLLKSGADITAVNERGHLLFDEAYHDYIYDEYIRDETENGRWRYEPPEHPTKEDYKNRESFLRFYDRMAKKYGKNPPDCLWVLHKYNAPDTFKWGENE